MFPESIPCVFGIGGAEKCGALDDGTEGVKGGEGLVRDAKGGMGVKKGGRRVGERKDARLGEIVVYEVRGKDIPIVHRVVRRFGGGYVWPFLLPLDYPYLRCFPVPWSSNKTTMFTLCYPRDQS